MAHDRAHVLPDVGRVAASRASAEEALPRYRTRKHEVGARDAVALLRRPAGIG